MTNTADYSPSKPVTVATAVGQCRQNSAHAADATVTGLDGETLQVTAHGKCMGSRLNVRDHEVWNFWKKIDRRGSPWDCWTSLDEGFSSYSPCKVANHGKMIWWTGHRFVLEWSTGTLFSKKLHVRHACDNRRCCNPYHLFIGTVSENVMDRVERCRSLGVRVLQINWDLGRAFEARFSNLRHSMLSKEQERLDIIKELSPDKNGNPTLHGSCSAYRNQGCRCVECRGWYLDKKKRMNKKRTLTP
jgi:hypothetical protein